MDECFLGKDVGFCLPQRGRPGTGKERLALHLSLPYTHFTAPVFGRAAIRLHGFRQGWRREKGDAT